MVLFFVVTDFSHLCYNILILLRRNCTDVEPFWKKKIFANVVLAVLLLAC